MINDTQKTIPYRLSEAELENLRLLRKRMNPVGCTPGAEDQDKNSEEIAAWNSDGYHQDDPNQKDNRL